MCASFMANSPETEFARCECCGLTEEYTAAYVESVRDLHAGKLICGLCSEAVGYEICRWAEKQRRIIGVEEALTNHATFCGGLVALPSPTIDFISAIGEMFRRRILDQRRVVAASAAAAPSPPSPRIIPAVEGGAICGAVVIGGSGSCLPALSGGA